MMIYNICIVSFLIYAIIHKEAVITVKTVGIVCVSFGVLSFLFAVCSFVIYRAFEHNEKSTDKVVASLIGVKHKKDVPVYGQRNSIIGGPIRLVMKIKNYSKGTYKYFVNEKSYKIRYVEYVTPKQLPRIVSVVFLKRFPKIAYVKTEVNTQRFDIYSMVSVLFSVMFLFGGFSVLF